MRSDAEQVAGLDLVGRLIGKAGCNFAVTAWPGGVISLVAAIGPEMRPGKREVVFASGGYDVWESDRQTDKVGLTAEQAAAVVIDEYRVGKAEIVVRRLLLERTPRKRLAKVVTKLKAAGKWDRLIKEVVEEIVRQHEKTV